MKGKKKSLLITIVFFKNYISKENLSQTSLKDPTGREGKKKQK